MNFPAPILLHYYITERCNCRCRFCDIWKKPAAADDASLADVCANLHSARRLGVCFVDFTGGEPLLHDDLPAMLVEAKKLGFQTSVTTNGMNYPLIARELAGKIDFLHFSLDALDATVHDELRGRPAFHQVMENIDIARTLGEVPDLLFTVTEKNLGQIKPLARFAGALGLMLIVNPLFSFSLPHQPELAVLNELEKYASTPFVYVNTAFHRLRRRGGNQRIAPRCRAMSSTLVISPDNQLLLPCYHFCQQKIPISTGVKPPIHEMTNDSTPQIHRQNGLEEIRKTAQWKTFSRGQGKFAFCQGCHLNCYADPSFLYVVDEYFWESLEAKLRYSLDKYVRRKMIKRRLDPRPAFEIAAEIVRSQ